MEGNYKKWINRINAKQDVLTDDNVGQFMDLELATKLTPTSGDTVLGRDSLTGKAVEIPTSSLGGNGNIDTSNLVPYTGANKDVNIGAYYFESSQGFKKTGGTSNQFLMADGNTNTYGTTAGTVAEGNHTHTFTSITSKPTTLSGYGITDGINTSDVVTTATANKILKLDANAKLPTSITGNADGNAATATKLQTARTINGVSFDGSADITINAVDSIARIASSEKGAINGVATLDSTGKVPSSQLPSYVDDVLEYSNFASFPVSGESGKIYIAIDTNLTYRWGGSSYVVMSSSLALGETSSTAYRGDRGKIAYDHSQTTGNPHGTTKNDIGLGNVDNTSDINKPISTATQTSLNLKANLLSPTFTGTVSGITATMVGAPNGSGNSTGINTGDNAVNTLYSGLVSNATHTGDVTGATTLTIANNVVSNAKLAQMGANTFKANNTGSTANATDITVAQAKTLLAISNTDVSGLGTLSTQNGTFTSIPQANITNLTTDLASKQATLVSATNIKTVNGNSLLGSGDLIISGGGSSNLDGLTDVIITTPINGQTLSYNGTNWVNNTLSGGGSGLSFQEVMRLKTILNNG